MPFSGDSKAMNKKPGQAGAHPGMSQLPSRRYPQHGALITTHHAGEAGPRALRGMIMTSCSSWLPGRMVIKPSASAATSSGVHPGPNRRIQRRHADNC